MGCLHILLVDDHLLFRKAVITALKALRSHWVFSEAENGQVAIEFIERVRMPDLVLLDVSMPVMDGLDAARAIKHTHPELPIVMLTQVDENSLILCLLQLGINGYLHKNTDPQEVITAIETVIQKGHYINQRIIRAMETSVGIAPENKVRLDMSARDKEILEFLCKGMSTKEIAGQLHLTETSIESYRKDLLHKTRTHNVAELISFAYRTGVLSINSENKVPDNPAYVVSS